MLFGLLARRPLLDDETTDWLFDVYAWALRHFGSDIFYNETRLITPTNADFPGQETSIPGMARLVFEQVKTHAGLAHWPCILVEPSAFAPEAPKRLVVQGALRGSKGIVQPTVDDAHRLALTYDPDMVRNPEALIASFAHNLAQLMGSLASGDPPGGTENWPHLTEVVAVFMGFGIMMANSAFNVRLRSCGACQPPPSDRASFLSQYDITYALAIFCVLKEIPAARAVSQLKSSLRGFFKKAVKEVRSRSEDVASLRAIDSPISVP